MSGELTFAQLVVGECFLFRDDHHGGGRHSVRYRVKISSSEYMTHWTDGKVSSHGLVESTAGVSRALKARSRR